MRVPHAAQIARFIQDMTFSSVGERQASDLFSRVAAYGISRPRAAHAGKEKHLTARNVQNAWSDGHKGWGRERLSTCLSYNIPNVAATWVVFSSCFVMFYLNYLMDHAFFTFVRIYFLKQIMYMKCCSIMCNTVNFYLLWCKSYSKLCSYLQRDKNWDRLNYQICSFGDLSNKLNLTTKNYISCCECQKDIRAYKVTNIGAVIWFSSSFAGQVFMKFCNQSRPNITWDPKL
jgi:hypothetical protein